MLDSNTVKTIAGTNAYLFIYDYTYIDDEAVIDALKDDADVNGSGRGQELSYYDGEEHDLGNGLFAYRID